MRYDVQPSGGVVLRAEPYPQLLYKAIADLPGLSAADQANSAQHWYRELNRLGLTSAVDAGGGGHTWPDDYVASDGLARAGDLPIRIGNYLFPQKAGQELAEFRGWTERERLAVNRASELLEGFTIEGAGENLLAAAGDYENFLAPAARTRARDGSRADGGGDGAGPRAVADPHPRDLRSVDHALPRRL
jgi:predicted amidohydrolase YtcJ